MKLFYAKSESRKLISEKTNRKTKKKAPARLDNYAVGGVLWPILFIFLNSFRLGLPLYCYSFIIELPVAQDAGPCGCYE